MGVCVEHLSNHIVLGAGGHARVLCSLMRSRKLSVLGILDKSCEIGTQRYGCTVLGDDSYLDTNKTAILVNGLGSLPGWNRRWCLAQQARTAGFSFATLIHPSAIVADDAVLEEGVQVMAGAVVQSGAVIGRDSIINTCASVDHDCVVEANCHLAPSSVLSGDVHLQAGVHIGPGAVVLQGLQIGSGSEVSAGSVVHSSIAPDRRYLQASRHKLVILES